MIKKIQKSQQRPGTASAGGVNLPFKISKVENPDGIASGTYASVSSGFLQNTLDSSDHALISGLNTKFQIGPASIIYLETVYDLRNGFPIISNVCEANYNGENENFRPFSASSPKNDFFGSAAGGAGYYGFSAYYDDGDSNYISEAYNNYMLIEKESSLQQTNRLFNFLYAPIMNYVATGDYEHSLFNGTRRASLKNFASSSSNLYYSTYTRGDNDLDVGYSEPARAIHSAFVNYYNDDTASDLVQFKSFTLIGYTSLERVTENDIEATFTNNNGEVSNGYIVQSLFSNLMVQGFVDDNDVPLRIPCPYSSPLVLPFR